MKAMRMRRHGGPEVLEMETCAEPEVGCMDVLVRVRACALNHLDLWVRKGLPGIEIPMPHIPGSDIAGVIETVGEGVEHLQSGDEVVLSPGVSCGHCEMCLCGEDNLCPEYTLLGYLRDGGYAEFVAAPAVNVLEKPARLSFEEAAAFPLTFLTAWHMLVGRAGLRAGETVLVLAAGSGVGSAAVQIAKLLGATVVATAGSEEKLARARELGADYTIDYSKEDFSRVVRKKISKRGVDVVFEHVGSSTFAKSIASLANDGRLVTCGATSGFDARLDLRHLFARHLTLYGSYMGSKGEMAEVLRFVEQGRLNPVVDTVMPLEDAAKAHARLENREMFGKIVLAVSR